MKYSFLSPLKLGSSVNKIRINMPLNNQNKIICKYLFSIGILSSYSYSFKAQQITIFFSRHYEKKSIINVKQISKPGRKVYITYDKLKKLYLYRKHFLLLSTSKGILSNKEAIRRRLGGELLFIIKC